MYDHLRRMQEERMWWYVGRRRIVEQLLINYLPRDKQREILVIGIGEELAWLNKYGTVHGIDPEPMAVEYGKTKVVKQELVQLGSLPDKIHFTKKFELVTLLDVLEHIDEDEKSLRFIFDQLLKEDGLLVITVPAYKFLWSSHDEINLHKRRYSQKEMEGKLQRAGFSILKLSYYNTLLFPAVVVVKFFFRIVWGKRQKAHSFLHTPHIMNALLSRIIGYEGVLLTRSNLPYGSSLVVVAKKTGARMDRCHGIRAKL